MGKPGLTLRGLAALAVGTTACGLVGPEEYEDGMETAASDSDSEAASSHVGDSDESESDESESEGSDPSDEGESSETGDSDTGDGSTMDPSDDTPVDCRETLDISTDFLRQKLSEFSGAVAVTIDGAEVTIPERSTDKNRALARKYLTQEYTALGYETWEHAYGDGGTNFLAQRDGDDERFLLIGAHYDSVPDAPGADDDGGGAIMGLAIAHALQDCELPHTVRIIGFDQEEIGTVGSRAYVKHLIDTAEIENFMGLLQLEMPGSDSDGDRVYQLIDCEDEHSAHLRQAVIRAAENPAVEPVMQTEIRCEGRSDHQSFWNEDQPAVMILERFFGPDNDMNDCYHRACDDVDQIDFEYMKGVNTISALAAMDLLEVPEIRP